METSRAPNGLSFVLFGIPRSGTTALAQAINLDSRVYCAHERAFAWQEPARQEAMISAVLADDLPRQSMRGRSQSELQQKVSSGTLRSFGDKLPEYYLNLEPIDPDVTRICIYRSPFGFTQSWDSRAADSGDQGWPAGRLGLFGILDTLLLARILAEGDGSTIVVSHAAMFTDSDSLFQAFMERALNVEVTSDAQSLFRSQFFRRRRPDDRAIQASSYWEILKGIGAPELESRMRANALFRARDFSKELEDYSELGCSRIVSLVEFWHMSLSPDQRAAVADFAPAWLDTRLRAVQRLSSGAESLRNSFQRLKALLSP